MPVKSFGQYLLDRGVITEKMLFEALEFQHKSIRPVCNTAVSSGRTSRKELARMQAASEGHSASEEGALRERIRSLEQLEASWRTLSERGVFLVEALSGKGYLSREQLDVLWKEYRQNATAPSVNLEHVLPHAPETRTVLESLIEIALDIFTHFTSEKPKILSITQALSEGKETAHIFSQKITGDINVHYIMFLSPDIVLSLASCMLHEPVAVVDQVALDTILELLNIMVGNTCTKFSMRDYSVRATPPEVLESCDFEMIESSKPVVVRARMSAGEFQIAYLHF